MIDINLLRNNIDEVESKLSHRALNWIRKFLRNLKTKEKICKLKFKSFSNQEMISQKK